MNPPDDIARGLNADELADQAQRERRAMILLGSPGLLLVGVLIFIPIGWLFSLSFVGDAGGLSLEHYVRLLHPAYLKSFETTLKISFLVTFICIAVGYPFAYLMSQASERMTAVLLTCVLFPFWTSLLVRTYAWLVLLQRRGVINKWLQDMDLIEEPLRIVHNFTGTTIGMVQIMLPFLVLPLYASMKAIDRQYMCAASNLGASPVKAFWQVFFPLSMPGLVAGVVLVFVLCLGFFVTPAILGGGRVLMWSMQIEKSVAMYANWGAASALGVVLLVVTLALLWLASKVFRVDKVMGA